MITASVSGTASSAAITWATGTQGTIGIVRNRFAQDNLPRAPQSVNLGRLTLPGEHTDLARLPAVRE